MFPERIDQLVPAAEAIPQTAGTRYLAAEIMQKRGFNPIDKMIDLAEELESQDECERLGRHTDRRLKIYHALAKFYAPQPKSVDISVKADNTFTIQAVDYTGMLQDRAALIPLPLNRSPALLGVEEKTIEADLDAD